MNRPEQGGWLRRRGRRNPDPPPAPPPLDWQAQERIVHQIGVIADCHDTRAVEAALQSLLDSLAAEGRRALPAEEFLDRVVTILHQQEAPAGLGIELCLVVEAVRNAMQD